MPRNLFLIPGLGAQGADAKDSVAGFATRNGIKGGALINASRGLLEGSGASQSGEQLVALIQGNVTRFNEQIAAALQ
jgi:orotidine-5'-phosphate decarboxylase